MISVCVDRTTGVVNFGDMPAIFDVVSTTFLILFPSSTFDVVLLSFFVSIVGRLTYFLANVFLLFLFLSADQGPEGVTIRI